MRVGSAAAVLCCALACTAPAAPAAPVRDGQWIWSARDVARLEEARAVAPTFGAGVWVASITYDTAQQAPVVQLALPPRVAGLDSIAAVIRLEAAFDAAWAAEDDARLAQQLAARLEAILRLLAQQPVGIVEVQLDYDVPVQRLPRWAAVLRTLRAGPLAGRDLWVTSLVAHLRAPDYARLMRPLVTGHIVQLFDTGEEAGERQQRELVQRLTDAELPFRFGVGAFERQLTSGRRTQHRAWWALRSRLAQLETWRGFWVFPGGQPYSAWLDAPR